MKLSKMIVCAVALLLVSQSALARRTDWRQMTVGHFHLYSTLRDSKTREIAMQLQAFERTVGEFLQTEDRLPDVPTIVYILDAGDFLRYGTNRPGLAGVFYERPYANVMVINGDLSFDFVKVTVFHEYTHFIQRNSSTRKMPPWFTEGYAELFSGFRVKENKITVGDLPAGVGVDMHNWISIERLLAVKQSDPEYRAERLAPQFYGESWALVHMLLFDDKSLTGPTNNYLENLDVGVPEPDAFANAFPFDKKALDHAVRKLIDGRVIRIKTVTYLHGVALDDAPIASLSAGQADAQMARLSFMLGWSKETGALAAAALKENPTDVGIRALSARIAAGSREDISDIASQLAKGGASDAQLRIDVAATLLNQDRPKEAADQAFGILDELVHTASAPLEAVALWVGAAALAHVDAARLLTPLEASSARAPHNTELLRDLAAVHETLRDKAKARDCYERIILVSDRSDERLWAQKQMDSARLQ
ncbi:MAG TPA: hypothetical protein VGO37_14745 [Steroidobacteraceae bacterium]|jgi:hypothetical protein|nr:hypothetical protein [Steroidobacteraceae bacterium]